MGHLPGWPLAFGGDSIDSAFKADKPCSSQAKEPGHEPVEDKHPFAGEQGAAHPPPRTLRSAADAPNPTESRTSVWVARKRLDPARDISRKGYPTPAP